MRDALGTKVRFALKGQSERMGVPFHTTSMNATIPQNVRVFQNMVRAIGLLELDGGQHRF